MKLFKSQSDYTALAQEHETVQASLVTTQASLTAVQEKLTASEAALVEFNTAMEALKTDVQAKTSELEIKNAEIETLKAQVVELGKAPGAVSTKVISASEITTTENALDLTAYADENMSMADKVELLRKDFGK